MDNRKLNLKSSKMAEAQKQEAEVVQQQEVDPMQFIAQMLNKATISGAFNLQEAGNINNALVLVLDRLSEANRMEDQITQQAAAEKEPPKK